MPRTRAGDAGRDTGGGEAAGAQRHARTRKQRLVYLTAAQWNRVTAAAAAESMDASGYLRALVGGVLPEREPPPTGVRLELLERRLRNVEVVLDIHRIGVPRDGVEESHDAGNDAEGGE